MKSAQGFLLTSLATALLAVTLPSVPMAQSTGEGQKPSAQPDDPKKPKAPPGMPSNLTHPEVGASLSTRFLSEMERKSNNEGGEEEFKKKLKAILDLQKRKEVNLPNAGNTDPNPGNPGNTGPLEPISILSSPNVDYRPDRKLELIPPTNLGLPAKPQKANSVRGDFSHISKKQEPGIRTNCEVRGIKGDACKTVLSAIPICRSLINRYEFRECFDIAMISGVDNAIRFRDQKLQEAKDFPNGKPSTRQPEPPQ